MYFITIPADKERFKQKLTVLRTDETGWITYYLDKASGTEWVEYYPYEEDRAPSILKRTDLARELNEIMEACFSSDEAEDWSGLGAALSSGEYKISEIAQELKEKASRWPKKALIGFKSSFRPIDNRNIVGIKLDEVERSYMEFQNFKEEIDLIIT